MKSENEEFWRLFKLNRLVVDGVQPAVNRVRKYSFVSNGQPTFLEGVIQCRPFFLASSTKKLTSFVVKDEGNTISFCLSSATNCLVPKEISVVRFYKALSCSWWWSICSYQSQKITSILFFKDAYSILVEGNRYRAVCQSVISERFTRTIHLLQTFHHKWFNFFWNAAWRFFFRLWFNIFFCRRYRERFKVISHFS